jgi:tetratricopeptide (TPR) repeat protein
MLKWTAALLVAFYCSILLAQAQQGRQIGVIVVNAATTPEKAVPRVRVSLERMIGTDQMTVGVGLSDAYGRVVFNLPATFQTAFEARLQVTTVQGLVIYKPEDGTIDPAILARAKEITLKLLPKGSHALLEPPQLEALIARLSKPNQGPQSSIVTASAHPVDVTSSLREWAEKSGFTLEEVENQLRNWADGIRNNPARATKRQKALAEFAAKNFPRAAELFGEAANQDLQDLDRSEQLRKEAEERSSKALRGFIENKISQAGALTAGHNYTAARVALEEGLRRVDKGRHRQWWITMSLRVAGSHAIEGELSGPQASAGQIEEAIAEYQNLLREPAGILDDVDRAATLHELGNALGARGQRSTGPEGADLLRRAVDAYRAALEVRTRAAMPNDWAMTQLNLGRALGTLGTHVAGAEAVTLIGQSVEAIRSVLEVYTRAEQPSEWALAQVSLGVSLEEQGNRSSGVEAVTLLRRAVEAFEAALEVFTLKGDPQDWAGTQHNLGITLQSQGERVGGSQALALLRQSAEALRNALKVYTKADYPQDWARALHNLGNILEDQGERIGDAEGMALLRQAVQSYRAALEVRTRADLPQDWARTEHDLGFSLGILGSRSTGAEADALLDQSVQAHRAALEVFTRVDLPYDWAMTQHGLGVSLEMRAEANVGAAADSFGKQAIQAFRETLEVRTKGELPQDWAMTQAELGLALEQQAERTNGPEAVGLLDQAVEAFRAALEVRTKETLPQGWARVQRSLGMVLYALAHRTPGAKGVALLGESARANRAALEVFTKSDFPDLWAATQHNLGNALRARAQRSPRPESVELLSESAKADRAALEVFKKASSPGDWALAQQGLSQSLALQGDWQGAVEAMENVLQVFPENPSSLKQAEMIYEHILFRFSRAFDLDERRVRISNSPATRLEFVETHLTTARFSECVTRSAGFTDEELQGGALLVRDALRLACEYGAGQKNVARETAGAILQESAKLHEPVWEASGVKHFVSLHPSFAAGQDLWVRLFEQLEKGDGPGLASVVRELAEVLKD